MANVEDSLLLQPMLTFHAFHTLLASVGMQYALDGSTPITLFAVPDSVFGRLPYGTAYDLMKDNPKLNTLMGFHIVEGQFTLADIRANVSSRQTSVQLGTISGYALNIQPGTTPGETHVERARILRPDIPCDNGAIHVIDFILWPPGLNLEDFGERSQVHGGIASM